MGITWKITMVLLSTLAALVIIVHSAEEEYDNQYRRGLRSRSLDTGTRRFEQPWRTLEVEPVMQQASSSHSREEIEDMSAEQPVPRRRRPGRKRKRRPEPTSAEESNERPKYQEEYRPHFDEFSNERQTSELPKRRRKKIERKLKWAESLEEDRPTRRRGVRRKRPTDGFPRLSEFNDYRQNETPQAEEVTTELIVNDDKHDDYNTNVNQTPSDIAESREAEIESFTDRVNENQPTFEYRPIERDDSTYSETSREQFELQSDQKKSIGDKSPTYNDDIDNSKVSVPIDPLTLKDILKKSNGTSLSEILQQHNLSLADLLHGKELALEILKSSNTINQPLSALIAQRNSEEVESSEEKLLINSEMKFATEPVTDVSLTTLENVTINDEEVTTAVVETTTAEKKPTEETTTRASDRRYPNGIRRKQRIRPGVNNYKSQINRDMIALTARKHFYNGRRRNATKSQEWKEVLPLMKNVSEIISEKPKIVETTTANVEIRTVFEEIMTTTDLPKEINETNPEDDETPKNEIQVTEDLTKDKTNGTEKLKTIPTIPETSNSVGLRQNAFNNVIKKKRRKQKYSTAEPTQQDDLFGMPNLVSSSELISKTQTPKTNLDDVTLLEDFITTETPKTYENKPTIVEEKPDNVDEKKRRRDKSRKIRYTTRSPTKYYKPVFMPTSTEETAKIEIEEILNDTGANAKLSKILRERNMTLNELVEHRERGSSHVHLADIFHNASKEPNPPEPFLSKSAIEPISKETYPLRALLDAHDTTTKATTIEPAQDSDAHIPMKTDFVSSLNENADSMGIMSLFNNISQTDSRPEKKQLMKDSQGTPYSTSIIVVNANERQNETGIVRESRVMHSINSNPEDIVGWNEIFSLMRRSYENKTKELTGLAPAETVLKTSYEEDSDGDGLIVLDDLQQLNRFNKIELGENQRVHERTEAPSNAGTLDKQNHLMNTKSVTLAAASIFGLALVLFLITYIAYRWRQQRHLGEKNYPDEIIPTPVFENRKGHKNNSSTRSISPMLTSNIYTLSTLDSQNGKESPDYMWDSLRKPFQ